MRTHAKVLTILCIIGCLLLLGSSTAFGQRAYQQRQAVMEDVVHLKNGSIIRGTIIEQVPNESLKIKTADGSVFVYTMDEVAKITKEEKPNAYRPVARGTTPGYATGTPIGSRKDPTMAFVWSLIIPGGGQFYNGQPAKGIIQLGLVVTGYVFFFVFYPETYWYDYYYYDPYYGWGYEEDDGNAALSFGGLAVAMLAQIWSLIDAPMSASSINRRNGWTAAPLEDEKFQVSIDDLKIDGKFTPGLKLKLSF